MQSLDKILSDRATGMSLFGCNNGNGQDVEELAKLKTTFNGPIANQVARARKWGGDCAAPSGRPLVSAGGPRREPAASRDQNPPLAEAARERHNVFCILAIDRNRVVSSVAKQVCIVVTNLEQAPCQSKLDAAVRPLHR